MAAFHHMIHRMDTLPLSEAGKSKEEEHIFEAARLNGYASSTIQTIIDKKRRDKHRHLLTTLRPVEEAKTTRASITFNQKNSNLLRSKFYKFEIELVSSSRDNQLKTLLGSTKDKTALLEKSGIYKLNCGECSKFYIGQTKRNIETRFEEHMKYVKAAKKEVTDRKIPTAQNRSRAALHIFEIGPVVH